MVNVTVQCSEWGEAVHLVLILDKHKNAPTACVQLQCCSAAGRPLICRDRGQLNFPCDSCCSRCSQISLQCSHLPPFGRCANHFRVAINRVPLPSDKSQLFAQSYHKISHTHCMKSNTSTCSYCMHSAESCTCFSLW